MVARSIQEIHFMRLKKVKGVLSLEWLINIPSTEFDHQFLIRSNNWLSFVEEIDFYVPKMNIVFVV